MKMMIKAIKTISMTQGSINNLSFEAGEGAFFNVNAHKVKFTSNPNDPVKDFTCDTNGHMEFDYHNKHYVCDIGNEELVVTLGDIAEFSA